MAVHFIVSVQFGKFFLLFKSRLEKFILLSSIVSNYIFTKNLFGKLRKRRVTFFYKEN